MSPKCNTTTNIVILLALSIAMVLVLVPMVQAFAGVNRKLCQSSGDCEPHQCCAETPIGTKMCIDYEKEGDICFFRYRTPSCGCAKGLRCVSTTPMEAGYWNHDYVCARVGPFNYFKLMPYLDEEENQV